MQLSEQQRAELERREWRVRERAYTVVREWDLTRNHLGLWVDSFGRIGILPNAGTPYLSDVVEVAAILGIAPPGYRLVPEEMVERLGAVCSMTNTEYRLRALSLGAGGGWLSARVRSRTPGTSWTPWEGRSGCWGRCEGSGGDRP
jgi:hypothetical protein